MKKTRELIEAHISLVDAICEVCDARIPVSSRNPLIDELTAGKSQVLILNKSDLANEAATREWLEHFRKESESRGARVALALNAMSGQGMKDLYKALEGLAAEKATSGKGKAQLPLRLMIAGIPNSGKSSLINRLTKRKAAQVGDRPGVTRGKQWITLENGMQLLDTPGILWPKFEDPMVGLNLAFCGSIKDEILDIQDLGLELVRVLLRGYPGILARRYGVLEDDGDADLGQNPPSALGVMEEIARKRGFLLPGKRIDYERTARTLLDEFRAGKLGRITLEYPGPALIKR